MTWTYLGEASLHPTVIGIAETGIAIGYGECKTGTFQILTINYFVQGLAPECCHFSVEPDPAVPSGQIEIADCSYQVTYIYGMTDMVNSNVLCHCAPGPLPCFPVPAKESTWGSIKTLYN